MSSPAYLGTQNRTFAAALRHLLENEYRLLGSRRVLELVSQDVQHLIEQFYPQPERLAPGWMINRPVNGLPPFLRNRLLLASITGSSGIAKGNLSMTTSDRASPITSTPSQKLAEPSNTPSPERRNRSSNMLRGCWPCTNSGKETRSESNSAAYFSARCDVNNRKALPSLA